MMAIEMAGGVYCPLSPRDPEERLLRMAEQCVSRVLIVHGSSKKMLNDRFALCDLKSWMPKESLENALDVNPLSQVLVGADDTTYTIFTSGSTGLPKGVSKC